MDKNKSLSIEHTCNTSEGDLSPSPFYSPWEVNPELTRRRAKELYIMYFWTKEQLIEHLGVPEASLNVWLYRPTEGTLSWKQERDLFEQTCYARMKERCSDEMGKSLARAMSILNRSLTEADMEGLKLKKPRDYKEMMGVIKELKNLINVEEGKPTAITQYTNLTQAEAKALVEELQAQDPFIDYNAKGQIN